MQARFSRKLRVSEARDLAHRAEHGDWSAGQELTERVYSWNREIAKTDDKIKKMFIQYLESESAKGDSSASIMLGVIYSDERWGETDASKAMARYCYAWKQGELVGEECLGQQYYFGKIVPRDMERAFQILSRIDPEARSAQSKLFLAKMYLHGEGTEKDPTRAVALLHSIADEKDEYKAIDEAFYEACELLSERYRAGEGIPRDPQKSRFYQEQKEHYQRQKPLIMIRLTKNRGFL